jgi:hypothetical protein
MSKFLHIGLRLLPMALLMLFALQLCAQDSGSAVSATGCLKQGGERGGYYVVTPDGKMYELMGKSGEFAKHLNHTVTVTGQEAKLSDGEESKRAASEKTEAGSNSIVDVHVASLKMVSDNCSQ